MMVVQWFFFFQLLYYLCSGTKGFLLDQNEQMDEKNCDETSFHISIISRNKYHAIAQRMLVTIQPCFFVILPGKRIFHHFQTSFVISMTFAGNTTAVFNAPGYLPWPQESLSRLASHNRWHQVHIASSSNTAQTHWKIVPP